MVAIFFLSLLGMPVLVLAEESQPNSGLYIVEYILPTPHVQPAGIAVAPDGNIWFTEWTGGMIGRMTPDGTFTEFENGSASVDIIVLPDGNIWFTGTLYGEPPGGWLGRITSDDTTTRFPIPTQSQFSPHNLTIGPDGNIWFTESGNNQIGMSTLSGSFSEYPVPVNEPHGITSGPDGNLWFVGYGNSVIGKITLNGNIAIYPLPTGGVGPFDIVAGPDGNLWFTEFGGNSVGRITTSGEITEFPIPSGNGSLGITAGADGNLWFTEPYGNKIGRITTSGLITEYQIPTDASFPHSIALGVDGSIWFTELFGNKIGRIIVNQEPVITAITAPINPIQFGQNIEATVEFNDPDVGDVHTVTWNWGDGSTTTDVATVPSVTTSHTYTSVGVYTVTATITDAAGESDTEFFQYVVAYDPSGGFVTGGGWINSPIGAYTPDPSLTGKATFGFVSKYKKGANVPTGNTEFQFKVADLNFKSTSYDWLAVTGSDYAMFKGLGTVNSEGVYKFMIWAGDNDPDTFRIKIWYEEDDNEVVIYDNGTDQEIEGGSIVVHTTK